MRLAWQTPTQKHGHISLVIADFQCWMEHMSCAGNIKRKFLHWNTAYWWMIPFDIVQVDVTDVQSNITIIYPNRQRRKAPQSWSKKKFHHKTFSAGKTLQLIRCAVASLWEDLSVRPLVRNAFSQTLSGALVVPSFWPCFRKMITFNFTHICRPNFPTKRRLLA